MATVATADLDAAARAAAEQRGLLLRYRDGLEQLREVPPATVHELLDALGPPDETVVDVLWGGEGALRARLEVDGRTFDAGAVRGVPFGVHATERGWAISAPAQALGARGGWTLFAPLFAMREAGDDAPPSYARLGRLVERVRALGGCQVAVLPLLPVPHRRGEASPYAPTSRLFWDELYAAPSDHALPYRGEDGLIDIVRWAEGRWATLARAADAATADELAALERFASPDLDAYAAHRATEAEVPPRVVRFAQLLAASQLRSIERGLQLDLPIGVRQDAFDVARWPSLFVRGASIGAPPDGLFRAGQCWGLAPLHPDRDRAQGYAYLRRALAHHASHADVLRIDHAAALERVFLVPDGQDARAGAFVRQRHPEELYALLCLVSHAHGCAIVGEDLGTVPDALLEAMGRRGLWRTWALLFALRAEGVDPVDAQALASFATHDLPTFGGWVAGDDLQTWAELGLTDAKTLAAERIARTRQVEVLRAWADAPAGLDALALHRRVVERIAQEPSARVVVSFEDLAGERRPQNVPGTTDRQHPNWRRVAEQSIETLDEETWLRLLG